MEEEMIEQPIGVYIKVNENKEVVEVNSDIFIQDLTDWIKVDDSTSGKPRDTYAHAQSQYFEKPLFNDDGNYNYKFVNDKIVEV